MVMIPKPGKDHRKIQGWRPIVLANTVGKWYEKLVAADLADQEQLWHLLSFTGRKGTGAMDSVMLMDQLRKETGGTVCGKDIKFAFNSMEKRKVAEILKDLPDVAEWVDRFLQPRKFNIRLDGRIIGSTTMTEGTPQGSPLSPALFTIYMSQMITEAQNKIDKAMTDRTTTRSHGSKDVFIPLSFVDDCNSVRIGDKNEDG